MKKINLNIKKAFTLAEMLITIGILGVVASMTLPTLMNNYQTEALAKKKLLFDERLEEAMNQMRFHEKLDGYNQTSDFVEELAKYLKINEICDVYNLTTCFYEEFKTNDGEIVDVATLTHGTDFALSGDEQDFSSENTSVTFADGTKAIMNYDKNCSWLDPYEGSSNREEATSCIAMIYDLNGGKGKNKIAEDISNLNGDFQLCLDTGTCWDLYYTSSTYLNTCDGSEYIDYDSTGSSNSYCATNYWAGQIKACEDKEKRLPTMTEIAELATYIYDLDTTLPDYDDIDNVTMDTARAMEFGLSSTSNKIISSEEMNDSRIYYRWLTSTQVYVATNSHGKDHSTGSNARCVK